VHAARALTITRPALSAGFFDDASNARIIEAWSTVLNIIGGQYKERWPDEESRIIFLSTAFTYQERLTALTFPLRRSFLSPFSHLPLTFLSSSSHHPQIGVDARPRPRAPLLRRSCERQVRLEVLLF